MSVPRTQLDTPLEASRQSYPFTLEDLPYPYDALEPHIDQKTLQVHHRKHHATYVKQLNEALAKHPDLHKLTLAELLRDLTRIPEQIRTAVKNNGGGHLNHDFFWSVMAPAPALPPRGALDEALEKYFGTFEDFRKKFSEVADKHFASGWVALALDHDSSKLEILDLKDHEIVTPGARTALLILDVWEHAYYLKYQNRRAEFVEAFWNVVNWARVGELFERAGAR
ncbi:MAG TPA: superoxide dismutase [Steroidobacteraceae bacterium]|nr:superoxide dismutase [Steroidobacteraceae bacterium]